MNYFKKWNLITGWIVFAVSAIVYIMTMEPTASLWDCGEFIATSYKLEVGHPPGAPLFMMIARFFTVFAPGPQYAALMVNLMSSLCGAFTILFLFWSITHLARKVYLRNNKTLTMGQIWATIGAGAVGALAYCFTDSQWFSAVEGEVYSMSSMFTAMVFWAILRWESVADEPHSSRWLVLIAYLMGLSIGIHILNLLTIPALVFVYYFKKYPNTTFWGVIKTTLVAGVILLSINSIIIPHTVSIGAWFDKIFVNSFGLPVNSGLAFFIFMLFALAALGIYVTYKKRMVLANIIILCVTFILLGYSSYASVLIRSSAQPPMNSNNPDNPYSLFSFLNRDQYGQRPLLVGPYYSSPVIALKSKSQTELGEDGKYREVEVFDRVEYPAEFTYFFPRVWDYGKTNAYKAWGGIEGRKAYIYGRELDERVPTAGENLQFFFSYQLNFMYWRYFMWNFAGRQNDIQATGELTKGNWISGLHAVDRILLGPQDNLPSELENNKARNRYYFLPFILGLIGLIYQLGKDKRDFTVVMWLFVMMGVALVVYFNTTPGEPRERDYVYTGSFYAFCIWIGLGVLALRDWLAGIMKKDTLVAAVTATVVCACVPAILVAQNWDDHDRSGRYIARDVGYNYLESTLPNAIILNYGDNDTFPLWYSQEVEGVRPDVRIMNMSYLAGDWYINQMKRKYNDSEPVPFSLPVDKYTNRNEFIRIRERVTEPVSLRELMNFIKSEDKSTKDIDSNTDKLVDYIPVREVYLPVNKENVLASGIVKAEDAHLIEDTIVIRFNTERIDRSELMLLDLLDNFDWKRPIHFTQPFSVPKLGLDGYLQFDGWSYRLVPIRTEPTQARSNLGRIDTEYLYRKLMETNRYGNVKDPNVYADYFTLHTLEASQSRNGFARLAKALIAEGDTVRAVKVLDRAIEEMPFDQVGYGYWQTAPIIEGYYAAGEFDKGNVIAEKYGNNLNEHITYFLRFTGNKAAFVEEDLSYCFSELRMLYQVTAGYEQHDLADRIFDMMKPLM